jgi:hypothetical protein
MEKNPFSDPKLGVDQAESGPKAKNPFNDPELGKDQESLSRGFKTAMRQIPQTIGGTIGLVGDAVGSDAMRDYGMDIYNKQSEKIKDLSRDSDSFTNVLKGEADPGEFLKYGTGYVGGQALTALATGGVGGFVGKKITQRGISAVVGEEAAKAAARRGAQIGAGAALGGSNFVQEAGSIYPEAVEQAQHDGRTLTGGDLARVAGAAVGAAAVDTAADALMLKGVAHGGSSASSIAKRAVRTIPAGMAREGATEGVQTGIERWGAQQDLTSPDAIRDYVDSAALGAVGGGLGGAASAIQRRADAPGVAAPQEQAGPAAEPLQLGNQPDPLIAFPDGTVGRQADVDTYLARLPEDQRAAERARMMGLEPQASPPTTEAPASAPAAATIPADAVEARSAVPVVPPSQAMGIDPAAGPLSAGAAIAVDSGVHGKVLQDAQRQADAEALAAQEQATAANRAAPPVLDYSDLDERDRSLYDDYFRTLDHQTEGHMAAALVDDVPDFGGRNVTDEQFLRALGANDQEIADALQTSRGAPGPEERAGGLAAPAADVAEGARPPAAAAQVQQRQAEPAQPVAAPAAELASAPTSVQEGIARARGRNPEVVPAPAAAAAPLPSTQSTPSSDVPGAKREKALRRVEEGKAWFLSQEKAVAFVSDSGLNETHRIVPQNRRFVVQQKDAASAAEVAPQAGTNGSQPKGEWTAFASDSGTKGVPRAEMPQIKAEHRGAMTNFMNARGIAHAEETVPAASLKPTQAEFSPARVQQAKEFQGGDRAILVSREGHVLDGHHQWLAARERGEDVRVIRLDAPIQDLLTAAHEFPSSTTDAASASVRPTAVAPENAAGRGSSSEKPARGVVAKVRQAKAKRELKADRIAREADEARAAYFTPGNIVRSYGGFDRVVRYTPADSDGKWSVTVRAVRQVGPGTFEPIPGEHERTHGTEPSARELKAGPEVRVAAPRQEAAKTAPETQPASTVAESIQDAGEKIGGARKDRWKERGLNVADLNEMSEAEGAELVTKANVWKPNWASLVSEGMKPETAASAKVIYDRLAAQPKDNTPSGRRRYVQMMQAVREVYSKVTPENLPGASSRLRDAVGFTAAAASEDAAARKAASELLFSVYKGRSDPFVLDYTDRSRVRKMVADGFPAKGEPWTRRFAVRESSGKSLTPRGRELTLEESAAAGTPLTAEQIAGSYFEVRRQIGGRALAFAMTRADAEAAARRIYEAELASADRSKDPERPHLDVLRREGLPQRLDRDATPDDFIRDFGFRGIEFGNWSAQDERQRIINMAYDGLSDLAQIMGVPPSAMSLNGTMGLAFGARGGGRFAAHYEPGRLVINMTKLRGGGSLAHEWAHALDHYFGELGQSDAYQRAARGASGWDTQGQYDGSPRSFIQRRADGRSELGERARLDKLRPEMAQAFDRVMSTIYREQLDRAALVRDAELMLERAQARLASTSDVDLKAMYSRGVESARQHLNETLALPPDTVRQGRKESSYYESSLGIREGKESYWTRPTEMFARAFESWAFDRIKAMGARSDYLVHGVESGVQYPAGLERARINEAFDHLASTIKTREGDNGKTAMFRRSGDGLADMTPAAAEAMRALSRMPYSPRARQQAVQSVQKTVGAIRSAWRNAPDIVVAFDMNDAAVPEAARRADLRQRSGGARGAPEGFYYRGKAYLMASRLATANDAARVLFHEVLGHHGLRGQFGKGLDDVLNQIGTMRRADVDAKIKEYGLRGVNKLDRRAAAEEVLAEMAQTHPELHFVRRAIAAIRTWLRQHVPGFSNLRMTDDEIVRNFILPARRFVEQGGPDGEPGDGLRFSRGDAGPASTNSLDAPIAANDEGVANFWHWYSGQDGSLKDTRSSTQGSGGTAGGAAAGGPGRDGGAPGRLGPVDAQGRPLVFFHGTRDDFTAFDTEHPNRKDVGWLGRGVYGASDPADANYYAGAKRGGGGQRVMPLYFAVTNPYVATPEIKARLKRATQAQVDRFTANLRAMGHDGVTLTAEDGSVEIVAFDPSQVKSAIGNSGAFDAGTSDIRFSRSTVQDFAKKATAELNKTFNAPGKLSWWHKTVGTMYNLAERSPAFKAVFDSAQGFVDDVSFYANDAAELAPKLLPKLETWRDIKKAPVAAADNAAVAKPVFEGTLTWARDEQGKPVPVQSLIDAAAELSADQKAQRLLRNGQIDERMLKAWQGMPLESYEKAISTRFESRMLQPGVVWTDAELRSMFNLSDDQIALYHEFRETTDRSLDTMARADMLRFVGDDAKGMRGMVMDAPDAQAAAVLLRDHLVQLANEQPDRATQILNTANGIIDRADKVRDLQARGYAPLSRFGRYSVDVVDAAGERQYFGLFETAREANNMAAKMREEFGDATVTQGTLSEEAFKLFAGVTPETLELFGNALGLDSTGDSAQDQAFQEYLRLTKTNRSAMRRLIHRKGIAGFGEDVGRVLASFIYSNARQTAAGLHMGDLGEAVQAIPKEQGELKDAAVRLADYVKNPQEEAQAVRGLLFAQYLGGSVASAFVNMTQPIAVTMPWLSQYGGAHVAAAQIGRAAKNIATRGFEYEPDLAATLKRAEDEGTVSPQEVHQLMAQARGASSLRSGDGTRGGELRAMGQNALSRLSLAWGKLFGAAEQVNRRITFVAAYRTAKAQGIDDPAGFARKAITETQFLYSKANKMEWGRGAIGGTLLMFKTYSVAYLELLHRMYTQGGPEGKRAALLALGMLMLMGGAGGLPFEEDLEDAVDALAQMLGYNFSTKKARQEFLESLLPKPIAQFIDKGVSGLPGAPLDVSARLGMGNLIPGTGLLLEKTSHARDLLEIAGPAGDFASRILSGGRSMLTGDLGAGLLEMSPAAVRNAAKGVDMAATGMYRDAKGYKVLDTNTLEAALKGIGFQPNSVATIQEANGINQQAKSFYNLRAQEIRARWAVGIFEKDDSKVQQARDAVADWNAKNPDQPMLITVPSLMHKVKEMLKSKDQRIADTAPRAMRAQMREDVARAHASSTP